MVSAAADGRVVTTAVATRATANSMGLGQLPMGRAGIEPATLGLKEPSGLSAPLGRAGECPLPVRLFALPVQHAGAPTQPGRVGPRMTLE
jgi:hypothetical protein